MSASKQISKSSDLSSVEEGVPFLPDKKEESNAPRTAALTARQLRQVLWPYFWPDKGSDSATLNRIRSSLTWVMVVLSKGSNLYAPFFLAIAANCLIAKNLNAAGKAMIIYCSLRLAAVVFREMQSILYIKVKQQASIQLQEMTFAHLHTLSLHWHLSKKTGSVMKSMDRGVEAANSMVTYLFLYLIPAMAECIAVSVLFFVHYTQWELGVIVLVGVGLYSAVTVAITNYRKSFREETNKHDNDYHDKATDSIINYETVKYFTGEGYETRRFTESVVKFQLFSSSTQLSINALNISQQVILTVTMLCAMLVSGRAVVRGQMTLGEWVAVQSWIISLFGPLNFLGSVYSAIFQAFIDIRNLSELLAESPDIHDIPGALPIPLNFNSNENKVKASGELSPSVVASQTHALRSNDDNILVERGMEIELAEHKLPSQSPPASVKGARVEFRNVCFHYPDQSSEKGLNNVSFLVEAGTTTALVGHTGAGKTTISRLLFRFYDPLSGTVLLNDMDIAKYTQKSVRQAIGIVPQDTVLFNDTILHNIRYGRIDASFDEVMAAAEAAQIRNFVESLPEQWNTVVGERGLKLSGGEKQRVAIARCLLKNPPIVLLDEATSALDTITENSIQEALAALGNNRTVLVIAHRLSTVKHAHQIVVLDAGRVLEVGCHDQLLSDPNSRYAQMWAMQSSAPNSVT